MKYELWLESAKDFFIDKNNFLSSTKLRYKNNKDYIKLVTYIKEYYDDYDSEDSFLIKCFISGFVSIPICKTCKNKLTNKNVYKAFPLECRPYCSSKCSANNKNTIKKRIKTNIKKYGTEHYSQTPEWKDAIVTDEIAKKKSDGVNQFLDKIKNEGKYEEWKSRIMVSRNKTILERYGSFENYEKLKFEKLMSRPDYKESRLKAAEISKKTIVQRYGSYKELHNLKKNFRNPTYNHLTEYQYTILTDKKEFEKVLKYCGDLNSMSDYLDVAHSTLAKKVVKWGIDYKGSSFSYPHKIICDWLNEQNIPYVMNDRSLIKPLELDLYLPEYNLAIEINGVYWHSSKFKDKDYHINKMKLCNENNVHLFQFSGSYIIKNKDKVFNIIKSKLNLNNNIIYARKCNIKEVNTEDYKSFCKSYHTQEYTPAKHVYGLYYNNDLIQCISFSLSRFNKNYQYELIRLCTKFDTTVIGGASKLFSHFTKKYNPNSIISYCDRLLFSGMIYNKLGFDHLYDTPVGYYYVVNNKLENRIKYQKHKLKTLKNFSYDESLTEEENMANNNHYRYYDCGQGVYVWKNKK